MGRKGSLGKWWDEWLAEPSLHERKMEGLQRKRLERDRFRFTADAWRGLGR